MKYYIINPNASAAGNNDYMLFKVKKADFQNFLEDYGHQVIASGKNLLEALIDLERWKEQQQ